MFFETNYDTYHKDYNRFVVESLVFEKTASVNFQQH
jgi:hypothetical protein